MKKYPLDEERKERKKGRGRKRKQGGVERLILYSLSVREDKKGGKKRGEKKLLEGNFSGG